MCGSVRVNLGTRTADRPSATRASLALAAVAITLLVACSPEGEQTTTSSPTATTTVPVATTAPTTTTLAPVEVDERYWAMRERDIEIVQGDRRIVFDTWFFAQLDDLGNVSVYEGGESVLTARVADSLVENDNSDFAIRDPETGDVVARISRQEFDAAIDAIAEEFGLSV